MGLRKRVEELEKENKKIINKMNSLEKSVFSKINEDSQYFTEYIKAILFLLRFRFEDIKMYELREKVKNTKIQDILKLDGQVCVLSPVYEECDVIKYKRQEVLCNFLGWHTIEDDGWWKNNRTYFGENHIYLDNRHGEKTIEETLNHLEDAYKFEVYSLYLYLKEQLEEDKKLMQYKKKEPKVDLFDTIEKIVRGEK